jgi:hypothetical protein
MRIVYGCHHPRRFVQGNHDPLADWPDDIPIHGHHTLRGNLLIDCPDRNAVNRHPT